MCCGDVIALFDRGLKSLHFVLQALVATMFVQIIPIFIIYGLNVYLVKKEEHRKYLTNILLACSLGGLLGDVFFHNLPHIAEIPHDQSHLADLQHIMLHLANVPHEHSEVREGYAHSKYAMKLNFLIVVGIMSFFALDKITHTLLAEPEPSVTKVEPKSKASEMKDSQERSSRSPRKGSPKKRSSIKRSPTKSPSKGSPSKTKTSPEKNESAEATRFKSYAVLSIVADLIHNFTDGLSIGVSFAADYKMGLITTMAMFSHEIPHTFGDFAILFQLNWTVWYIAGVQLMTGTAALAGTVVGAMIGQIYLKEALAFCSGGFLYFAINGLLGELKSVDDPKH